MPPVLLCKPGSIAASLVQNAQDPTRFSALGEWCTGEEGGTMRSDPRIVENMPHLRELCAEGGAGVFRQVVAVKHPE